MMLFELLYMFWEMAVFRAAPYLDDRIEKALFVYVIFTLAFSLAACNRAAFGG